MKAYLITTGTLFGLMAVVHVLKAVDERDQLTTNPWFLLGMVAIVVIPAALSVWAWRLLAAQQRRE